MYGRLSTELYTDVPIGFDSRVGTQFKHATLDPTITGSCGLMHTVTMDASSDENVYCRVRLKRSSEQGGYGLRVF